MAKYPVVFKRDFTELVIGEPGIPLLNFDQLWEKNGVLFEARERKYPGWTLPSGDYTRLLEPTLKDKFAEWSIAIQEPEPIYTPGNVRRTTGKCHWVGNCRPLVRRYLPSMVEDEDAESREQRLHSVEHLFHAGAIVLIFLMQFAQDVNNEKVRRSGLYYGFNKVLAALTCHQEGEKHVVLVDQSQIWDVEAVTGLSHFAEALCPSGLLGVKLEVENLFWRWCRVTQHGMALSYPGGNVICQEALTYLRRTQEEHITRLWDETRDKPL